MLFKGHKKGLNSRKYNGSSAKDSFSHVEFVEYQSTILV